MAVALTREFVVDIDWLIYLAGLAFTPCLSLPQDMGLLNFLFIVALSCLWQHYAARLEVKACGYGAIDICV
ncbi:hypothetical protein A9Q89_04310 [Gammaproteobacteria bacterium 53_120_T64]|nr:hypothetical protein A9Q89_04310 [Gammaproteobacteria bacterium 53_120_T64]